MASKLHSSVDADDQDTLLAALVELHRRKRRIARSADDGAYGRVLEHFERRATRQRAELLLSEELIERALGATRSLAPPQPQQELAIEGAVGAVASGRFRIRNRASQPTVVECVSGDALEAGAPAVRFEPARVELEADGAGLVRVMADLRGVPHPGSWTIPVECRAPGRRDRLWLTVTAVARHGGAP